MRTELLILGMSLAVLGIPKTVAAAKVFDVTLVACSTPGLSVCFRGGGTLTLQKGAVEVDDDGDVRLSVKGIEGTTAIELQPPYTLGLLFFTVQTTDGVTKETLKAGTAGHGKVQVKGAGPNLQLPTLPLTTPVRVQARQSSSSTCWEATFSTPITNTSAQFKAKSD